MATIEYLSNNRYTNLAIMIEGVGNTLGQYRFSWGPSPSFDSDNLYLDCLNGWPSELGTEIDFRDGSVSSQSQTFYLLLNNDVLENLFRLSQPTVVAEATSGVAPTATSLTFNSPDLEGEVIFWEREAILVGTLASTVGGISSYTGCTRGYLGTQAVRHGDSQGDRKADNEIFTEMPLETRRGRIVKLIRVAESASSYDDEEVLFVGLLESINIDGALELAITTNDVLSIVKNATLMSRQATWNVLSNRRIVSRIPPDNGYGDFDSPTTSRCIIAEESSGYVGIAPYEAYRDNGGFGFRLLENQITQILNYPKAPSVIDEGKAYKEVHTTFVQDLSNSASPDTWTLPLSRDPGTLILQLLTTFPNNGTPRSNGDYDLGLDNLAGGVPLELIDVDAIINWSGRVAGAISIDNLWLGLEGEEKLFDVISKILRAFGSILCVGREGKLTIASLSDTVRADQINNSILEKDIESIGAYQDLHIEDSVIRCQVTWQLIPGVGTSQLDTLDDIKNRRLAPGGRSQIEVNADFISDQFYAQSISQSLLYRFRYPPSTVVITTLPHKSFYPGDTVKLTHSQLFGHKAKGVSEGVFLVIGRKETLGGDNDPTVGGLGTHTITYTLSFVGAVYNRLQRYIAPAGSITAWSSGTKRITIAENEYSDTYNESMERDSDGFQAGDFIQIVDQYGTVEEALCEIDSVSGNNIFLVNSPTHTPIAGDIIRVVSYSDASTFQTDTWAFISDADGLVDGLSANSSAYVIGG